jgi:hypothetical protein
VNLECLSLLAFIICQHTLPYCLWRMSHALLFSYDLGLIAKILCLYDVVVSRVVNSYNIGNEMLKGWQHRQRVTSRTYCAMCYHLWS